MILSKPLPFGPTSKRNGLDQKYSKIKGKKLKSVILTLLEAF